MFDPDIKTCRLPIPEPYSTKEKIIRKENDVRILTHRLNYIHFYGDDNLQMSYENMREDLYHDIKEEKKKLFEFYLPDDLIKDFESFIHEECEKDYHND